MDTLIDFMRTLPQHPAALPLSLLFTAALVTLIVIIRRKDRT